MTNYVHNRMVSYKVAEISVETMAQFIDFAKTVEIGTEFLAKDAHLAGATLTALVDRGIIDFTGRKEEAWVRINDDTMKRIEVKVYKIVNSWTMIADNYVKAKELAHKTEIAVANEQINSLAKRIETLTKEIDKLNRLR